MATSAESSPQVGSYRRFKNQLGAMLQARLGQMLSKLAKEGKVSFAPNLSVELSQTDFPNADEERSVLIKGKTLEEQLNIWCNLGDGLFPTKIDHSTIDKFDMYPFNGDWTNSLFFSQDPVAMDSVMYDFLYTEGTNPIEGSQNYLHQSAEPMPNEYDPEGDGEYLDYSLGVHEHWDTNVDIFSPDRYTAIDYVAIANIDNSAPNKPTISGPTSGKASTSYEYTISTTDPAGDAVTYCIAYS